MIYRCLPASLVLSCIWTASGVADTELNNQMVLSIPNSENRKERKLYQNQKVVRGGNWVEAAEYRQAGRQILQHANTASACIGFRCIFTASVKE